MFKCPHCNKREISFMRKLFLIKSKDICYGCGKQITTSFGLTMLVVLLSTITSLALLEIFNIDMQKGPESALIFAIALITQAFVIPVKKVKYK